MRGRVAQWGVVVVGGRVEDVVILSGVGEDFGWRGFGKELGWREGRCVYVVLLMSW